MIPQSRRRRRQKKTIQNHKKQSSNVNLFATLIVSATAVFIFTIGFSKHNDIVIKAQTSSLKLEQCKSSCNDLILSSSENLRSLLTSTTLATLFLLRENNGIERGHQDHYRSNQSQDLSSESRPKRLPRIFEILVGEIEGIGLEHENNELNNIGNNISSINERRSTLTIATKNKDVVWSDAKEKHRMITLNNEWEGALRWIAGWGLGSNEDNWEKSQSSNDGRKGKAKRNRYDKEMDTYDHPQSKGNDGTGTISVMLNVCVEECLKKNSSSSYKEEDMEHVDRKKHFQFKPKTIVKRIYPFFTLFFYERFSFSQCLIIVISMSSSISMWHFFTFNQKKRDALMHEKRSNQVSYWLSIMGENEKFNDKNLKKTLIRKTHKRKKRVNSNFNSAKTKSGSCKNDCQESDSSLRSNLYPAEVPDIRKEILPRKSKGGELIQNSFVQAKKHDKSLHKHQTQIYNELPRQISFCRSDFNCNKSEAVENKWQVIEKNPSKGFHSLTLEDTQSCVKGKPIQCNTNNADDSFSFPKTLKSNVSGEIYIPTRHVEASFCSPIISGPKLQDQDNLSGGIFLEGTETFFRRNIKGTLSSGFGQNSFTDYSLSHYNKTLSIPTNKQREEASRQLREFQMAQVSKLIQKKSLIRIPPVEENGLSLLVCRSLDWDSGNTILTTRKEYQPSKFRISEQEDLDAVFEVSSEHLSGDELLLSNMLDEDEEELELSNSVKKTQKEINHDSTFVSLDVMKSLGSLTGGTSHNRSNGYSLFRYNNIGKKDSDKVQSSDVAATSSLYSWGSSEHCSSYTLDTGNVW